MIDFDCLDGIEAIILGNDLQQQRQVEHSLTGKVNCSTQAQPQSASFSVGQLQLGLSQHQEQGGGGVADNQAVGHTDPILSSNLIETTSSRINADSGISTASCRLSQSRIVSSMSTPDVASTMATNLQSIWRRNDNLLPCLLITANVGTIFEESTLLELWFQQLKDYLIRIKPRLVAIHCQEVGGKNFESSMKNVSTFTDKILGDHEIIGEYSRVRIFLDENIDCMEKFTALGSLYLIHDSVQSVKLYNFATAQYDSILDRVIFKENQRNNDRYDVDDRTGDSVLTEAEQDLSGLSRRNNENNNNNIDLGKLSHAQFPSAATTKVLRGLCEHVEKIKFPQDLFPDCRWSRKGFMRTRWLFNNSKPLDLVNIHLFHDASNLIAMKTTPSPYAQNRQRALEFALQHVSTPLGGQEQPEVPMFIFGDFNFRLDTNKVIQKITEGVLPVVKKNNDGDEVVEFIYHRKSSTVSQEANSKLALNDYVEPFVKAKEQSSNDISNDDVKVDESVVMTIGKKLFDCENLDETFRATKNTEWLQEMDNELDKFKDRLFEFKISFSPSYPFKEDKSGGYSYMKTRCPAWCDRILFNSAGRKMIFSRDNDATACQNSERKIELLQDRGDVIYRLMGNCVPMGDHKPVLLYCQLDLSVDQDPSNNQQI